ncbi:MAG: peptide chain release factor N(5)-glutamine methyltransferase [Propionibacterium sp.]|nr:peptide chain release factor N(5)-glutamine methyltransferase [Propionibacterium sp.]
MFELADAFAAASLPSPSADARLLVAHAAGVDVSALLTKWELDDDEVAAARALAGRRLAGEPVQHITGEAHFRYETLAVGPGVFIPRPETELVAGWAIDWLAPREGRRVVELCAGSGAIIRSIVRELGGVVAHANERSRAAEPYLRKNLEGCDVEVHIGDLADAFPELAGMVDLVVVNPPYVPETVRDALPGDVMRDPEEALFAGEDGLGMIGAVAGAASRLLTPGGALVLEHDESHQAAVLEQLRGAGFTDVQGHRDLAGRDRFATAVQEA